MYYLSYAILYTTCFYFSVITYSLLYGKFYKYRDFNDYNNICNNSSTNNNSNNNNT